MKKPITISIIAINLIVISLIAISSTIILTNPKNNAELTGRDIQFRWIGINDNYNLIIDDNEEFVSPDVRAANGRHYLIENLELGAYYWKISDGSRNSSTRAFTIESSVAVNLSHKQNSLEIENVGNTNSSLFIQKITGLAILDLPYKKSVELEKESTNITIKQK